MALRCRAIPVSLEGNTLYVAMADPYDVVAIDEIRRYFARPIEVVPRVASATDIAEALAHYDDAVLDNLLAELEAGEGRASSEAEWEHPVIRFVNAVLTDGVRQGASDIHFEPEGNCVRLRYRIDGVLRQIRALHATHWSGLSHRLKIMAGLNIADTRSLQDGRFEMNVAGAAIDFRMAVMPVAQGENIVVRILDRRRALLPLDKLGFGAAAMADMERILERPEGIILVTGPTGCGKTTTLYSMLNKISSVESNIMTLEEPIEYQFELIRQTAVQEEQGLGFVEGVRGILRQDPDVIFIGEVRDPGTAQMALRSAMTGHQVFSTLHCIDALGALPRLVDLELHPRMLAGHISGVIAQRLVRRLCPQCRGLRAATDDEARLLKCVSVTPPVHEVRAHANAGFTEAQSPYLAPVAERPMIGTAVGCEYCHGTGYRGRAAVAEILRVTPELDELIATDAPRAALYSPGARRRVHNHGRRRFRQNPQGRDRLRKPARNRRPYEAELMPAYRYRAVHAAGHIAQGTAAAANERELVHYLNGAGLELIEAREKREKESIVTRSVSPYALAAFCAQMGDMLEAGLPLMDALETVGSTSPSGLRDASAGIMRASHAWQPHRGGLRKISAPVPAGSAGDPCCGRSERRSRANLQAPRALCRGSRAHECAPAQSAALSLVSAGCHRRGVRLHDDTGRAADRAVPQFDRQPVAAHDAAPDRGFAVRRRRLVAVRAGCGPCGPYSGGRASHLRQRRAHDRWLCAACARDRHGCEQADPRALRPQLAILIQSGLSVSEALAAARGTLGNRALEARLATVVEDIHAGQLIIIASDDAAVSALRHTHDAHRRAQRFSRQKPCRRCRRL